MLIELHPKNQKYVMLPFYHKTQKNLSLSPFGEFFVQNTPSKQFYQNSFYPIFNIYAAATSCKEAEKLNAFILLQKKNSFRASFCPNIPVQGFSWKDHMSQFQAFTLLQLHRENQKNSKHQVFTKLKQPYFGLVLTPFWAKDFRTKIFTKNYFVQF